MKKIIAFVLVAVLALALVACGPTGPSQYETFMETEVGQTVTVEAYVQGHQSWWNNQLTVYLQDKDGGYFAYNMECTKEQAEKLTEGTKIKVTGKKAEWAGEIEIYNPCQLVEIIEGDTWVAPATDVTAKMGTDELINYMNRKVSFKGLTVVAYDEDGVVSYDPDKSDSDVYFKAKDAKGNIITFCVEYYLTNSDTETYQNALNLKVGDVIDVESFLYWYNGANPHVTSITVAD